MVLKTGVTWEIFRRDGAVWELFPAAAPETLQ